MLDDVSAIEIDVFNELSALLTVKNYVLMFSRRAAFLDHNADGARPTGSAGTTPVAAGRAPVPVSGGPAVTLGQPTSSTRSPWPSADLDERTSHHERNEVDTALDSAWRWPQSSVFDDGRPVLPRRARQKHLAPQLQDEPADVADSRKPQDDDK